MTPRTIVVTGAASGIGRAVAELCLRNGARVAGIDLDAPALDAQAATWEGFYGAAADISDEQSVRAALEQLIEHLGGVDGLVNCAGIGGYTGDVTETPVEAWQQILAVNLTGAFLVSRAVLPLMRGRTGSSIVHVSSQYGVVGGAGFPAYCAAKAALIGLTKAMAIDHAADGVRVNCVCPGPTDTPMLARSIGDKTAADRESQRVRQRNLLGKPADPATVATVIDFLLGPGAVTMTGAIVPVDAGWTAG